MGLSRHCRPLLGSVVVAFIVVAGTSAATGGSSQGPLLLIASADPHPGLYALIEQTGELRRLTTGHDRAPSWSRNAQALLFTRTRRGEGYYDGRIILSRVRATATGNPRLADSRVILQDAADATWSPSGRSIAFARADGLYVRDVRTSKSRKVLHAEGISALNWGARGIFFARLTGGIAKWDGERVVALTRKLGDDHPTATNTGMYFVRTKTGAATPTRVRTGIWQAKGRHIGPAPVPPTTRVASDISPSFDQRSGHLAFLRASRTASSVIVVCPRSQRQCIWPIQVSGTWLAWGP